jgi:hypothetical protein
MRTFWRKYLKAFRQLWFSPALYVWFMLIASGGHSPTGKVVAALASVVLMPAFFVWQGEYDDEPADKVE